MKKTLSVILCLVMILSIFTTLPFEASAMQTNAADTSTIGGTTGDCTWQINGTVLTISGIGKTANYDHDNGWYRLSCCRRWRNLVTQYTCCGSLFAAAATERLYQLETYCLKNEIFEMAADKIHTVLLFPAAPSGCSPTRRV